MKNQLRKILSLALALCFFAVPVTVAAATAGGTVASPWYYNATNASAYVDITANGVLSVDYDFTGKSGYTTSVNVDIEIEKLSGNSWVDVDDGQWNTTIYQVSYSGTRRFLVNHKGTYRATVTFTFYGTGGPADELVKYATGVYTY